ncbi:MAG: hypothetical protein ACOY94_00555 [Bacillota bacterium]
MATVTLLPESRNVGNQLVVADQPVHRGGEGSIYFSTDGRYVVKVYHKAPPDKVEMLRQVVDLGRNLGEDEKFLAWPLGIVNTMGGQKVVGVVTRRVPSSYTPLYKLVFSPVEAIEQFRQKRSWVEYLKIARGAARALWTIHGKGMAHADIHTKNFLADPQTGDVVLIDLDGLVVKGFLPPQVKGVMGFIAPEVMMGKSRPGDLTDRHSLAVLILWILLLRNVMHAKVCYDEDPQRDDELSYGEHACFSEHPADRRNWDTRVGIPLFRNGLLSYRTLPQRLQDLTERALIHGLHDPVQRPQVQAWERALADAYDLLIGCPNCQQTFFYPHWVSPPPRRQCPFCGSAVRPPYPAVLEIMEPRPGGLYAPVRPAIAYHGLPFFADIAEPGVSPPFTRRGLPVIGQTSWDRGAGVHRLENTGDLPWQVVAGGTGGKIGRGESVALKRGLVLSLGAGRRVIRVVE